VYARRSAFKGRANGEGAPAGPIYAALMAQGCTLEQFEQLMGVLVETGRLRKQGHLYFVGRVPSDLERKEA
jgi:hypothetical protein